MTLQLSDVHNSLSLFAEEVAGRPIRVEARGDERRGWPWDLGLPDPDVVELAPAADAFGPAHDQRLIYRAQVLHHVGLLVFGTFGDDPLHPAAQAAPRHPLIVDSTQPALAAGVVVLLEHLRVSAAVRRFYPGARRDIDRIEALARREVTGEFEPTSGWGIVAATRLRCVGGSPEDIGRWCQALTSPQIEWLCSTIERLELPDATLDDSARIAVLIAEMIAPVSVSRHDEVEQLVVEPASEHDEPGIENSDMGGFGTSPPFDEIEVDALGERADLPGAVSSAPISLAEEFEQLEASTAPSGRGVQPQSARPRSTEGRTYLYDEWNYHKRAYQPAWCRVVEHRTDGTDLDFITDVRRRHADLRRQIRRQFAMLRPQERQRVYRRDDGDELDLEAIIEAITDRRSGVSPDDRLTIRRDPIARDVATAFLVDLSASTSSPTEEPEPPAPYDPDEDDFVLYPFSTDEPDDTPTPRRVIDVAKESVALMCDALDQLGDQHAVYGFSGDGHLDVEFHVGKEFDESTSTSTWAALAGFEPIRYTRMGPAVRHTARRLASTESRTKLLIIISDGHPQDSDYGPDRADKSYGLHDTAKAVAEATAAGVDTFCVTIDRAGNDYLRVMFPDNRYLIIDEVESLPDELAKLYLTVAG